MEISLTSGRKHFCATAPGTSACQPCFSNPNLKKRRLIFFVIYFLLEELKTFYVLNICSVQCAKRNTLTTETVLLGGQKYNKTNCSAGGCKGSAVHGPGTDGGSRTLVLNSDHWHKAFGRVFLLMLWARVHSRGEEGFFH